MAAYGSKCDIPLEQVEKDAIALFPHLEELTNDETNHFKKSDITDALKFYRNNKAEVTYRLTRNRISELTKIDIQPNKRNGRKQADHIIVMNKMKEVKKLLGEEINEGRPDKAKAVKEWQRQHPAGTKAMCNRDTGIDPKTIRKWWDNQKNDVK